MNRFNSTFLPWTHKTSQLHYTYNPKLQTAIAISPAVLLPITHHKPLLQRIKEPKFKNVLPLGFCVLDLGVTGLALFPNSSLAWIVTGLKDMGWYGVGWYPCP
jgi:hypothetical protein